jgi:nucleoside-diphosphate-sugar epimerase
LTQPLRGINAGNEFSVVYHLAAINGTRLFYEMPFEVARTNLLSTLNLLEWLQLRTVGRLVYASTSEVYADAGALGLLKIPTSEEIPVVFTQPTKVRFSYGTSKFMGEFLCLQFGKKVNVSTSVVRYHNIYGPRMGDKHVIPEFIARIERDENPFRIYGGSETRAFCYVDDAVEATYRIAAASSCDNEVIHIGNSDEEISIESLAKLMMKRLGKDADILECGGRSGSVPRRCPDVSKLHRLTGFKARINLEEGLSRTLDWYLNRAAL